MKYSREVLYRDIGQYDEVVVLTLRSESESAKTFGRIITGCILYSPDEREELQEKLEAEDDVQTDGKVRIQSLIPDYPNELRKRLEKEGVNASDIIDKLHRPIQGPSEYKSTKVRNIPGPKLVIQDDSTRDEMEIMWMRHNINRVNQGEKLLPFELDEQLALMYRHSRNSITDEVLKEHYIDSETGKIKDSINIHILKGKFLRDEMSEEEHEEFEELNKKASQAKLTALSGELNHFKGKRKDLLMNNPEAISLLTVLLANFKDEKLTHGSFVVWWDADRFLHVYVGHVGELQLGERKSPKTMFQYQVKDIRDLVKAVLQSITDEIDEHFDETPEKEFIRNGERAVMFNGDYYQIRIAPSGKLMQFHKL